MPRPSATFPLAFPEARPRAFTGESELKLAAALRLASRPRRVTAFLTLAYESIAGEPPDVERMRRLSTGTREALLQSAALRFHPGLEWFETRCVACGESYDITVPIADAPRRPAGAGFPVAVIETSLGRRSFEAPNGIHEESLAAGEIAASDPRRAFAALCGLAEDAPAEARLFTEQDLAAIDDALEAISPDVADETQNDCPACGAVTAARIEPFRFALPRETEILQGVHLLARSYGWLEDEILRLPAGRRRTYEAFVAADDRPGPRWRP